jgi:MFS family permease
MDSDVNTVEELRTIESSKSWVVAFASMAILAVSYGSPLLSVIAMQPIAAAFDNHRSIPALASSLVWLGSGAGGILMGPVAQRLGVRWIVLFGGCMIGTGFVLSTQGGEWSLLIGHGLFVGILGTGSIHAPLYIYVSHWFDRHRGTALALIASGQYVGGAIWPFLLQYSTAQTDWYHTMIFFGVFAIVSIVPMSLIFLRGTAPENLLAPDAATTVSQPMKMNSRTLFSLLCLASVLCCVPMAMPTTHLPALCGDLGISATRGAAMLSLLLGMAFLSRQFWGWLSDWIGGLATVAAASACQSLAVLGFAVTTNEAGLFFVSAAFGLGFSGIIPAYFLAIRELFPANQASWRIPTLFFSSLVGMFIGGWLAGAIYDYAASYVPAFALGFAFNIANVLLIIFLVTRTNGSVRRSKAEANIGSGASV